MTIDPRLLAVFDVAADCWRINAGRYVVEVGHSSRDLALRSNIGHSVPFASCHECHWHAPSSLLDMTASRRQHMLSISD